MKFFGEHVFITGGSGGMGSIVALKFLEEGAVVTITSKIEDDAIKATNKISDRLAESGQRNNIKYLKHVIGDLSKPEELAIMFETARNKTGSINILVNCVGITSPAKFEDISVEEWNRVLATNLTSYFLASQQVASDMKKDRKGKIIYVASIAARRFSKLCGIHYSCSKAAILALTRQLATELGPYNINVNCICPSQTYTNMLQPFLTEGQEEIICKRIPLGYIASPEQQANVILFLASEEANYVNGAILDVTGGQL